MIGTGDHLMIDTHEAPQVVVLEIDQEPSIRGGFVVDIWEVPLDEPIMSPAALPCK
jgi:hypothetical protein